MNPSIPASVETQILAELARIEAEEHVRVLYAGESGDPEPLDRLLVEILVETNGDRIAGTPKR